MDIVSSKKKARSKKQEKKQEEASKRSEPHHFSLSALSSLFFSLRPHSDIRHLFRRPCIRHPHTSNEIILTSSRFLVQ